MTEKRIPDKYIELPNLSVKPEEKEQTELLECGLRILARSKIRNMIGDMMNLANPRNGSNLNRSDLRCLVQL